MYKILLTYLSFTVIFIILIIVFVTATTFTQLAVAVVLYPVIAYFGYKVLPYKSKAHSIKPVTSQPTIIEEKCIVSNKTTVGVSDIDKRVFLKLVGGAGLFFLVTSFFNRRVDNILARNLPGSLGFSSDQANNLNNNPTTGQPMEGYKISEIDNGFISYYGYTHINGGWFIMRVDTVATTFRYARGASDYPKNWANREKLKYDYFNNLFKS